ncbi:MAG TPA: PhzF family phenazine biosynthesis protein [Motilibacterales bacterium]|nr:PhzF family phenazine biosynthesis protein [Motilibacterales bacterium]
MRRRFVTCDVFTDTRFGGNPLAVVLDAEGLSSVQMQQVAREFNYSETTFVLPAEQGHDRRVRIFTPAREVPFAGHPNVGTAFVLASLGEFGPLDEPLEVTFEELAGLVPVSVRRLDGDWIWCELRAPEPLSLGPALPVEVVAAAVGLTRQDIEVDRHAPRVASVGLEFVVVELVDGSALERARPDSAALDRLVAAGASTPDVHLYVARDDPVDGFDLRTRMFAPFDGVFEDPATGSANCALVGLLASLEEVDGEWSWRIAQGVEMGRPSVLDARVQRVGGQVADVWIGGDSVLVTEGTIEV